MFIIMPPITITNDKILKQKFSWP